jgi:hypothetical protein
MMTEGNEALARGEHEVASEINEWIGAGTVSDDLMHQIVWALANDKEIEGRLTALIQYAREIIEREHEALEAWEEAKAADGPHGRIT